MNYLLICCLVGLAIALAVLAELWRRAARAQMAQLRAHTAAIEGAGDKLATRMGRIADRTERVEKALLELLVRADALMSQQGIDVKAHRQSVCASAVNRCREGTGISLREALATVENLDREMGRPGASA